MHKALQILVFLTIATPTIASADPMSVYGSADARPPSHGGVSLRGGVGSLFGPAFRAGQPAYAHSDGFDWENREPFTKPHQMVTTFGLAGALTFGVGNWVVGPTIIGGFNATRSSSDDFSDISLNDSYTGATFGGGLHAARVAGPMRLTLDVLASYSSLKGELDWSYSDFFADDTLVGSGKWQTSYVRVAGLVGVELDIGSAFLFLNGGAQFLPEQTREEELQGSYPKAHTKDPFSVAIESNVQNKGRRSVTYDQELSLAASAGLGLRF